MTVASGTAMAQIILLATLPVLTRNLDKAVMGEYFYGISMATIFVVLANFRLDMAVFLEERDSEVINILKVSFLIAITVGFVFLCIAMVLQAMRVVTEGFYFWLSIALIIFSLGMIAVLQSIYIQNLQYNKLSLTKIFQSLIISAGLLMSIKVTVVDNTLLAFHALGMLLSMGLLVMLLPNVKHSLLLKFDLGPLKSILIKYRKFPLISMPAGLINNLAIQLPVIIIGVKFGAAAVAIYALMMRVMLAPISLIGGSILSVFKEKAATEYHLTQQCATSYKETFKSLFLLSIVPLIIGMLFIKKIFILVFGVAWAEAGVLAQIMMPMFFLKFMASPLSYIFFIADGQKYDLMWQISLLFFTILSFALSDNVVAAVKIYSLVYTSHYFLYLAMSYQLSKPKAFHVH